MKAKGRAVPIYRPGLNRAGEVAIPACDLTLPDGRKLIYAGLTAPQHAGGGAYLRLAWWRADDGLQVAAQLLNQFRQLREKARGEEVSSA